MNKTDEFILSHRNEDVRQLALKYINNKDIDIHYALTQISAWQKARIKLPLWAQKDDIIYPEHLPMEQCSSQATAEYKLEIVKSLCKQENMIDLTAGFGVDCSIIGQWFKHITAIDRNEELCKLLLHNLPVMGCDNISVINEDCEQYLTSLNNKEEKPHFNLLFIDPARRDKNGNKTFLINDCSPDVCLLNDIMLEIADIVMIKLSPMLDLTSIESSLKGIYNIHVVSVNNECKEILIVLKSDLKEQSSSPEIVCVNTTKQRTETFKFTKAEEATAVNTFFDYNKDITNDFTNNTLYLYEPNASIMKSGAYKTTATKFGLEKIQQNSHLYISTNKVENFPGRQFKIVDIIQLNKEGIKKIKNYKQANLTTRNFPQSVNELRKKLNLRDGGNTYMFATTMNNNLHYMIVGEQE